MSVDSEEAARIQRLQRTGANWKRLAEQATAKRTIKLENPNGGFSF